MEPCLRRAAGDVEGRSRDCLGRTHPVSMNRFRGRLPLTCRAMNAGSPPDAEHLLQHAAFVRAVARATLHGDDLVDDVVQETWVAALIGG